jgi:peptidoglycan/xylan/chitin deacetylase (PgdA/CDA1 family)
LSWAGPALAAYVPWLCSAYGIPRRLATPAGVALTFDDGPHRDGTPAVLDELARRDATATFFLVGEQVRAHPGIARAIADAGHEVGVHGDRHSLLLRRGMRAVRADFDRAAETIAAETGDVPTLYRPPYGIFSSGALREVRRRDWRPLLWSTWGRDWERRATPATIARRATRGLRPGDVVLLHDSDAYSSDDSWRRTVGALPSILDAVAALGTSAVSVTHST